MVLVNAVYFKGLWATKFRAEATSPREFRYSDGSARPVPFMHTKRAFRTGYDNELGTQVLILPFEVCKLYLHLTVIEIILVLSFGATFAVN